MAGCSFSVLERRKFPQDWRLEFILSLGEGTSHRGKLKIDLGDKRHTKNGTERDRLRGRVAPGV